MLQIDTVIKIYFSEKFFNRFRVGIGTYLIAISSTNKSVEYFRTEKSFSRRHG